MKTIDIYFCIAAGLILYRITKLASIYWVDERLKNLYVSEIECPKCHARPGVPCFFSNGYACPERWEAVHVVNIARKDKRDRANRKP